MAGSPKKLNIPRDRGRHFFKEGIKKVFIDLSCLRHMIGRDKNMKSIWCILCHNSSKLIIAKFSFFLITCHNTILDKVYV